MMEFKERGKEKDMRVSDILRMSNETYDTLKWITTIVLPALGTLYFALSGIWGFPYGEQIVGTITAVVTFLGVILGISNHDYKVEQKVLDRNETDENQLLMAEAMLEEDEQKMVKGGDEDE